MRLIIKPKTTTMKTLELKEIAGYLPYGLKVLRPDKITILEMRGLLGTLVQHEEKGEITYSSLSGCKPILRPMSDLTREITHKGEKFVPMDRISSIYIPRRSSTGKTFGLYTERATDSSQWMAIIDHLNEWMFDYRGLIYQGLAIDVNTLKANCYE